MNALAEPEPLVSLTAPERANLETAEATIEKGLKTFVEVGRALCDIRNGKLYRAGFGTFEDYCRERWDMSDRRARQIMDAADVVAELKTGTAVPVLPETERQTRPLAGVEPARQPEAWKDAVDAAGGKQPTTKQVQAAADKVTGGARKPAAGRVVTVDEPPVLNAEDESQEPPESVAPDPKAKRANAPAEGASAPATGNLDGGKPTQRQAALTRLGRALDAPTLAAIENGTIKTVAGELTELSAKSDAVIREAISLMHAHSKPLKWALRVIEQPIDGETRLVELMNRAAIWSGPLAIHVNGYRVTVEKL